MLARNSVDRGADMGVMKVLGVVVGGSGSSSSDGCGSGNDWSGDGEYVSGSYRCSRYGVGNFDIGDSGWCRCSPGLWWWWWG